MNVHYLDSSAWVKRYFAERGSNEVASIFRDAEGIACSLLGMVEVAATIVRKGAAEHLPGDILDGLLIQARADFAAFEIISLSDELMKMAEGLGFQHRLRAADAIHLASALSLVGRNGITSVILVSSDIELLAAAGAKGLRTLNPAT